MSSSREIEEVRAVDVRVNAKKYQTPRIEQLPVAGTLGGGNPSNKENGHFSPIS